MDRRAFLAVAGSGLAGLAGCGADGSSETGAPTGEEAGGPSGNSGETKQFGRSAAAGETSVTVWDVSVRSSIRYAVQGHALDVYAPGGAHLAFVRITTDGETQPERATFGLAVADGTIDPLDGVDGVSLSAVQHRYSPYVSDEEGGSDGTWLLFEAPPGEVGDGPAVVWQPDDASAAEWSLPGSDRDALAAPVPRFELERFEIPETAPEDEKPIATIVVTNTSDVDGTFRATVNYRGALSAADNLDLSIPAGETSTTEYEIASPPDGELQLELAWSGSDEKRTIDFG